MNLYLILVVSVGGAIGSGARYAMTTSIERVLGSGFPWWTMGVNVLGSLLMGAIVGGITLKFGLSQGGRAFLTAGVLGGFTTFSAYSLDVVNLFERQQYWSMAGYAVGSVVLSILALVVGFLSVRMALS